MEPIPIEHQDDEKDYFMALFEQEPVRESIMYWEGDYLIFAS